MNQFVACLKKDFLEAIRTKRLWYIIGISIGMVVLLAMSMVIINMANLESLTGQGDAALDEMLSIFNNSYLSSMAMFGSFMGTYFLLVSVILFGMIIPKEIKNKQWVNPISAGIKPQYLIASKLIISVASVLFALIIGCLLHLIFTLSYCNPDGSSVGVLFYGYAMNIIYILFLIICTVSISAIAKRTWVPWVIVIACMIFLPDVLNSITVGGYGLSAYTPFLFGSEAMVPQMGAFSSTVWVIASLVTVAITVGLVVWAILSNKLSNKLFQ